MHLPVDLPDGRSTTSYTLRDANVSFDPRGSRGVFRKSTMRGRSREEDSCHPPSRIAFSRVYRIANRSLIRVVRFLSGGRKREVSPRVADTPVSTFYTKEFVRRRKLDRHRGCLPRSPSVSLNGKW